MSIYTMEPDAVTAVNPSSYDLDLTERSIYRSSRVGTENIGEVIASTIPANVNISTDLVQEHGNKRFELSNHLGNVLQVVSDRKLAVETAPESGIVDYYIADVVSQSDYYPFVMMLPNTNKDPETGEILAEDNDYRYSFQGQEKDDEIKGENNSVNYKYRMHDPRVGRFFATDPIGYMFAYNSPYAFSENVVINAIELEGLERIALSGAGYGSNYKPTDIGAFERRAARLKTRGYRQVTVSTGEEIFAALKKETIDAGQIERVAIFSHGWELGIAVNTDQGFHTGDIKQYSGSKTIADLVYEIGEKNIKFSDDAIIYIGACNCGKNLNDEALNFGYQLTKQTGVTTVSPTGIVEPLYDDNGVNIGMRTTGTFLKRELIPKFTVTVSVNGEEYTKSFISNEDATKYVEESKIKAEKYEGAGVNIQIGEVKDESEVKTTDLGKEIKNEDM